MGGAWSGGMAVGIRHYLNNSAGPLAPNPSLLVLLLFCLCLWQWGSFTTVVGIDKTPCPLHCLVFIFSCSCSCACSSLCVSLFCVHLHHFPAVCVINNWHIVRTSCACIASCHHHFINARFSEFVNNTVTVGHRAPHACQPDIMNRTTFWACADQHSMARHLFRGFPL